MQPIGHRHEDTERVVLFFAPHWQHQADDVQPALAQALGQLARCVAVLKCGSAHTLAGFGADLVAVVQCTRDSRNGKIELAGELSDAHALVLTKDVIWPRLSNWRDLNVVRFPDDSIVSVDTAFSCACCFQKTMLRRPPRCMQATRPIRHRKPQTLFLRRPACAPLCRNQLHRRISQVKPA